MDSRRAESFSDGVFAVAITVLVFNLLPVGHGVLSYRILGQAWPTYAAYVVSFLTIGIMWLNHHTLLRHIVRVDRVALVLNLVLLMGVVAVPWPTALVAEHLTAGAARGGRVAAVVYGLVLIAISIGFAALWLYLAAHQKALADRPITVPRQATIRFTAGLAAYVAGAVVAAFFSPGLALAIYGLIAVYYLFEHLPTPADGGAELDQTADAAGDANSAATG
jgi:uncharacterized membrane protein